MVVLCAVILTACAYKQPISDVLPNPDQHQVTEFVLKNGMKVIVKEDHRAPLAIVQIWYRVGASDEHNGITGISHALEHMMFKGTKKYSEDELTEIIKREGGRSNAFTGPDYTAYYEVFEKSRLSLGFEIEADRMLNLVLEEDVFLKELEVVKEERRWRTDDKLQAKVWEQLYATAFHQSPYGWPVIGWMDDLNNLKLADLAQWYRQWYNPANAFILVAGDVNPNEVRKQAIRYMEPIPAGATPVNKPRREAPQQGERRITVEAYAKKPFMAMGYRVPNFFTADEKWEVYALQLLSAALAGNTSARFSKNLIRGQKIAISADAGYDIYSKYDDLFAITATPLDNVSLIELERAIEAEITALKEQPISQDELERIKVIYKAGQVFARDSISRQAYQLGRFEAIGAGWGALYETIKKLEQVTPEQIQAVANKYLVTSQRTVAHLDPKPIQESYEKAQ